MKKVGIVLVGIVILVGVIYCLPKEEREVLLEEKESINTSLAFYLEQEDGNYIESTSLPQTGYTLNTEKSVCTNNTTPVWKENKLYLNNLKDKGTSCYLYFNIYKPTIPEQILKNYSTQLTRTDFNVTVTETTTGTIYYEDTSKGRTYYFAGNPTDNWVQFGGFYWRIIRINEDGTIRMIYQGTAANATGEGTQIGTSAFNSTYTDNMYVGYMYTSGSVHGLGTDSTIKGVLDTWYQNNLSSYSSNIDGNAGFCGDREPSTSSSSSNGQGGTESTQTYYGAYIRLITNKAPTFECTNSSDLYTVSGSSNGNKSLQYPIGLISADEVAYAGGVYGKQYNNYLYTNNSYCTMTPSFFNNGSSVFPVDSSGYLDYNYFTNKEYGVRPVINLKADVTLTGSGTSTDPYVVEGAA